MKTTIDKAELKKQIIYNVKTLYRRTIDEATPQQVFQAVSYALKDDIIDQCQKPVRVLVNLACKADNILIRCHSALDQLGIPGNRCERRF